MGGHSLKATVLAARIQQQFQVRIPLNDIFKIPTIRQLSARIKESEVRLYRPVEAAEKREYYPLSSAQKRLYFLYRMDMNSSSYNMPSFFPLDKDFETDKLEAVLKQLIARHDSLRTSFDLIDEHPVQMVAPHIPFELEIIPSETRGPGELFKTFIRPFDLSRAPLMRSALVELADGSRIWMMDIHHIVTDGISNMILQEEFFSLYNGETLNPPQLPVQYKDFSLWQNRLLESQDITIQWEYWLKVYADSDEIEQLDIPADFQRPKIFTNEGHSYDFNLNSKDVTALKALASQNKGTFYMSILAVLNILFYKYTGQTDIVIGSGTAGRSHADLQRIVGMFINTLPMRNQAHGEKSYRTFLKEVINRSLNAFENQDVQLEELIDRLNIQRDLSRNPLFDVLLMGQNFNQSSTEPQPQTSQRRNQPDAAAEKKSDTSKFDLTFYVFEHEDHVSVSIEYYTRIFRLQTIQRMAEHFGNLLSAVVRAPSSQLKDIQIISAREKQRVLYDFNATDTPWSNQKEIHRIFEDQVSKTPNRVAVEMDGHCLSYGELNKHANRLARYLQQNGLTKGSAAGVLLHRSFRALSSVFAVLKTGSAFLNMDPEYPDERLHYMINDANLRILLTTDNEIGSRLGFERAIIDPDPLDPEISSQDSANLTGNDYSDFGEAPFYIIYTSGSTGTPKGVLERQLGLLNRFNWMWEEWPFAAHEVCCQKTSFEFRRLHLGNVRPSSERHAPGDYTRRRSAGPAPFRVYSQIKTGHSHCFGSRLAVSLLR